jgi:two-component system chemotaxis response regulator CheY
MKTNVLIVEDEVAMRVYLKLIVSKSSLDINLIHEAGNGKEALEVLTTHPIDLILTDIHMPVMDGVEFLQKVHNHPTLKEIPAIAITTENTSTLTNMLSFWGHGYIQKPANLAIIEDQISKFYTKNDEYYLYG